MDSQPLALLDKSAVLERLAWVAPQPPHRLILLEHWLAHQWRAGDVGCFLVHGPAPTGLGYIGTFALGTNGAQPAWLRTKRRLKKGAWRIATVVATPREEHKHLVLHDSLLLKGRYLHLSDLATSGDKLKTTTPVTLQGITLTPPETCRFIPQVLATRGAPDQIRQEAHFLSEQARKLKQAQQQHLSYAWQESAAYTALRRCQNTIYCNTSFHLTALKNLARQSWADTSEYLPDHTQSCFSDFQTLDHIAHIFRGDSTTIRLPNQTSAIITPTPAGATIDINQSTAGDSREILTNLLLDLRLLRIGGRLIIDLPATSVQRGRVRSLFHQKNQARPEVHPAQDDLWSLPCPRLTFEFLSPRGLLVLQQQSYDQSLTELYAKPIARTSTNELLILHQIFQELPERFQVGERLELILPPTCLHMLKTRFSESWQDFLIRHAFQITLKQNQAEHRADWTANSIP